MESDLIPYHASSCLPANSVLVLAPHPDDEVFACGGAIAAHVGNGVQVCVVVLTDGALYGDAAVRQQESMAAAKVLGYGVPEFWNIPDRTLQCTESLVQALVEKIRQTRADLVYAPSPWEIHPDHRQAQLLATEAVRRSAPNVRVAFYEVGAPLRPNVLLNTTALQAVKEAAMRRFSSQLRQQDYLGQMLALNRYRSYTLGPDVLAAEAYWVVSAEELSDIPQSPLTGLVAHGVEASQDTTRIGNSMVTDQTKECVASKPRESGPAVVSVLIRTMNRSSLNAAIASVVAQSFANWEIVVVNASGTPLTCLRPAAARHITRLLEPGYPLNRGAAANALLDAALGQYAIFLDDDDEFLPDHLQKLADFMASDTKFVACYSDVTAQLKSEPTSASPRTHTYQREFDWMLLQFQNYLPIHSVMFRLDAARGPVKVCFDEELTLFEDWDFWLQLSSKGNFKRVPGVSALYMLDSKIGSGHAVLNAELRETMLLRLSTRQLARWNAADIARLIAWESQRTESSEHAAQQITSISQQLVSARAAIHELTDSIKAHQGEIDKLGRLRLEHLEQINQTQARVINLSQAVNEQRVEIGGLREQRAESQRQIEQAQAEIAGLGRTLQEHQKTIESLNGLRLETLQQLDHARVRSVGLEQRLAIANSTSMEFEQRLGVAVAAALDFEQRLRTAHANEFAQQIEIEKLGRLRLDHLNQLEQLNVQLLAMYESRSWQLTRPFRVVRRLIAWLASSAPPRLIGNGLRAAVGEVRRHGLSGFVRRLPHYLRHRRTYGAMLTSPVTQASQHRFSTPAPSKRQIRLHPELIEDKPPIAASVSVVIPTFNAGLEFRWLLRKLKAQQGLQRLEIVIVDSGSSDDTVAYAKAEGCRVVEITQAEFSHSHSRNLGAAHASADYLIFMVQDAYPIGEYWAYGMLRYLLDNAESGLVAASCSEYSRSDSDMMYDSMIDTHYRFLGCHEQDRIGSYQGSDHMALRSRGQLSDVACLISRDVFSRYGYQGDYAEDLDLGIRLIKDGHRVAMLASVKVIHSHNRPAFYYLKRSYVDVIFLVGMFDDFLVPPVESEPGLVLGIASCARHVSELLPDLARKDCTSSMSASLAQWTGVCRHRCLDLRLEGASQLGDAKLDRYIDSLGQRVGENSLDALARAEAMRFADSFFARLEHFNSFASGVYGTEDALLQSALQHAVRKTFAAAAGSALGFMFMDSSRTKRVDRTLIEQIDNELRAGV